MYSNEILAIIPARSGSKGILNKNIAPVMGHPLLAWSIAAAKQCKYIDRVIVSTDSAKYATVAQKYGAETPFLRPAVISTDAAQDVGFLFHTLLWLAEHEGKVPSLIVHLRPTSPNRDPKIMDQAIEKFLNYPEASSLCSAHEVAHPPCKYFRLNSDDTFSGLMGEEFISFPRQQCPKAYQGNGYIDILRSKQIIETGNLYGAKRLAFLTPPCNDIDNSDEFNSIKIPSILYQNIEEQK